MSESNLPRVESSGPVNLPPGSPVIVPVKSLWKSKTFWIGVVVITLAAAQLLGEVPAMAPYREWVTFIAGVLMVVMRVVTNAPATLKGR